MCGIMKVIPPATPNNSSADNATEGSGDTADVVEGSSKRKKRQVEGSGADEAASASTATLMLERTIAIVEDSKCDAANRYTLTCLIINPLLITYH